MNPYLDYVKSIESGVNTARALSVSGKTEVVDSDSCVLIFAPHPDDECIIGLLALRLMREGGRKVVNVPVTFGSHLDRRTGRAAELKEACAYLGWDVLRLGGDLQNLKVEEAVSILSQAQPEVIMLPHAKDWNARHISTHKLLIEALENMPADFSCTVVETEFWGAMHDPNLMVEGDAEMVADLVAATSLHVEEVARNPYHLLLPAWMQDNVRRGGELVGGQGSPAPAFSFSTLYRLRKWEHNGFVDVLEKGSLLPMGAEALKELF